MTGNQVPRQFAADDIPTFALPTDRDGIVMADPAVGVGGKMGYSLTEVDRAKVLVVAFGFATKADDAAIGIHWSGVRSSLTSIALALAMDLREERGPDQHRNIVISAGEYPKLYRAVRHDVVVVGEGIRLRRALWELAPRSAQLDHEPITFPRRPAGTIRLIPRVAGDRHGR